jgi:hypothetical protein
MIAQTSMQLRDNSTDAESLNDFFSSSIIKAANIAIPKEGKLESKRLPERILSMIKRRDDL